MNPDQQAYLANLDAPSPPTDIQRYKDAVRDQADRAEMEIHIREEEPHLSSREVRREIDRRFKRRS